MPRPSLGRVLIADDEDGVRKSLTAALTRAGFDVIAVDDGAPAIARAIADGAVDEGAVEIVLVDLHMPTGGLTVIRHYKQRYGAGVYCAVLSGEDDEATREDCLAAGADEVFCKPVPAADLRRRLTEVARALRASAAGERSA
jgi:DNA-binding response OmpR family regulator